MHGIHGIKIFTHEFTREVLITCCAQESNGLWTGYAEQAGELRSAYKVLVKN
jgi:hypothetical protein